MNKDEITFATKNKIALQFLMTGTEDYIGARVLFLQGVIVPGYVLAEQAIEKLLKSYILLLSPDEKLRDKKKYPSHDLTSLINRLSVLSGNSYVQYVDYCFILSKVYYCMRYPEKEFITDFSIFRLSTQSIDQLDELFLLLYVALPIPDANKCRLGPLSILLLRNDPLLLQHFVSHNISYVKEINYFSKPASWWFMTKEEQAKQPSITLLAQ